MGRRTGDQTENTHTHPEYREGTRPWRLLSECIIGRTQDET
jgi:hypothetical protein